MDNAKGIIAAVQRPGNGRIIVFSGPSGSGKTTICKRILNNFENLTFSVSHTTREIRKGETDGKDYLFVSSVDLFREMISGSRFAEYAEVYGNYYGTTRETLDDIMASGKDALLDIDVQGGEQIRAAYPELSTLIFVLPPSIETLEERLRNRGKDSDEVIKRRLRTAASEIEKVKLYDFVLINDDLNTAVKAAGLLVYSDIYRVDRYLR
ncbi:MAG: guanylate kinase [bacterium]|nr:guanylate kinase [bacterium]